MNFKKKTHIIVAVIVGITVSLAIKSSLFEIYKVPSESMIPTIYPGDRVLVNKASYRLRIPFIQKTLIQWNAVNRGDLIIVKYPSDPTMQYVKRVIALPGETISIKDGLVFINNALLEEPYLAQKVARESYPEILIPPGRIFVMGDNRGHSIDSRIIGLARIEDIEGSVAAVI